jgi:hypothetical protein
VLIIKNPLRNSKILKKLPIDEITLSAKVEEIQNSSMRINYLKFVCTIPFELRP